MDKIFSVRELKEIISNLKSKGKKIVFTNGCFDIIHFGHISYLKESKSLGDILIVAINSDSSVKRLKPDRPIIPEKQRAEVLSALEMIDYVIVFNEDTPFETIKVLQPDVLVKGGDWKKEEIVGFDIAPEVHSLPYVEGVSTTEIINRIVSIYKSSNDASLSSKNIFQKT